MDVKLPKILTEMLNIAEAVNAFSDTPDELFFTLVAEYHNLGKKLMAQFPIVLNAFEPIADQYVDFFECEKIWEVS